MENVRFEANFWSAVKRKNMLDLLTIIFTDTGHIAAAKISSETNKFTSASVDRMMKAVEIDGMENEVIKEKLVYADIPVNEEINEKIDTYFAKKEEGDEDEDEVVKPKKDKKSKKDKKEDEDEDEVRLTIGEIKDLCATGKKKNIKKAAAAFEKQFQPDYPEYDEYRKIIKKAKKALKNAN